MPGEMQPQDQCNRIEHSFKISQTSCSSTVTGFGEMLHNILRTLSKFHRIKIWEILDTLNAFVNAETRCLYSKVKI